MYKLSDVAKKLNVEKVLLFEMLLTKGEYLEGNVIKKHGVTYLSDDGIEIIDKIIRGEKVEVPSKNISAEDEIDLVESDVETEVKFDDDKKEINLEQDSIIEKESINRSSKKETLESDKIMDLENEVKYNSYGDMDSEDEKNDEVRILEILTEKSKFFKFEKEEKRNRISNLRNEFILLDSEIRKKQEALESYDKILEEDIQWVCILEDKFSAKLKENLSNDEKNMQEKKVIEKMFFKK